MQQIGRRVIRLESIDSTNNYTANLVRQGNLEHGTVILAVEQFAGRGQREAVWTVKPGENLTMSLFLDDANLSVDNQFILTKFISLTLVKLLGNYGVEAKIKWPNDIYVGNQKIAGVLIENQISGNFVKSSIIGVGLNVNQVDFRGVNATSLFNKTGIKRSIDEVMLSLIYNFNQVIELGDDRVNLKKRYLDKLYRWQVEAKYEDANGRFYGTIVNVRDSGLLVLDKNGIESEYDLKELKFIF